MESVLPRIETRELGYAPVHHVRPLDLKHLRRYTLGDRSLEQEVLTLYIEQTPISIDALRTAQSDKAWYDAAHALKGSSRAVGAWGMARLAEQAERLSGIADSNACGLAIRRLEQGLIEVREFLVGR